MGGRVVRARRRGPGKRDIWSAQRVQGEVGMFNALASLAQHRAKRTVIIAAVFFVVAGALGGSVAKHLDPYGADDPSTQSVIADNKLEDAGFRDASVIVLIQGASPTDPAGQARIGAIEQQVKSN